MYKIINGIVLNRTDFHEYDRIVLLYTLELGKIKCLFKSVNKPEAKLIYFTEPATEVELQVVKLKNKNYIDFFKVTGGRIVNYNIQLRTNLEIYNYTCKILNLIDSVTLELSKDENKFFLLKRIFEVLPYASDKNLMYLAFVYRVIKLAGYMPQLYSCVSCKTKINKDSYFDILGGGVICDGCYVGVANKNLVLKISFNTIKLIQNFYKLNAYQINNLKIDAQTLSEAEHITNLYLQTFIHKPLVNV